MASEVLPLCDACRFLEREAPALLRPRRLGRSGRPAWLWGVTHEVRREPLGVILVVGPTNYPLLLPGVHMVQALAAGNAVLLKPGAGGTPTSQHLLRLLRQAALPDGLVALLPEAHRSVQEALAAGVDKVILTGSLAAGRAVLPLAAQHIVPAVAELSGDDPCVVCCDADLRRVARALAFARRWNDGNTCIAPRRVIVVRESAAPLREHLLRESLRDIPLSVAQDLDEALTWANASPFALGAAVFGPERTAAALAARLRAGVVLVNDVIVPTADPRVPFGGRGQSGYGVTRGPEGLLEMTAVKVVSVRHGSCRHFEPLRAGDAELVERYLRAVHGHGWWRRWRARLGLVHFLWRRRGGTS